MNIHHYVNFFICCCFHCSVSEKQDFVLTICFDISVATNSKFDS